MSVKSSLKYFTFKGCPFCRPIDFLLQSNKVAHEETTLDLLKGEHKSEEFKQVNPFQKVPTIVDNDYVLFESNTVLRYLANSKKEIDPKWYPTEPKARSQVDLFLDWHSGNIGNLNKLSFVMTGCSKEDPEVAKRLTDNAANQLLDVFLSRHKFAASNDTPTLADLTLVWHLYTLIHKKILSNERFTKYVEDVINAVPGIKENLDDYIEFRKKIGK